MLLSSTLLCRTILNPSPLSIEWSTCPKELWEYVFRYAVLAKSLLKHVHSLQFWGS